MDTLTFISNLVSALVWPSLLLGIMMLFKSEVANLLGRIKKIKHKGSEIDLAEEISDATKSADKVLSESGLNSTPEQERIRKLAQDSPRGAILDSWLSIEEAMVNYLIRHGVIGVDSNKPHYNLAQKIRMHNLDAPTLGQGIIEMLDKLKRIRNDAVHQTDADITTEIANEYTALAIRVKAKLEEA